MNIMNNKYSPTIVKSNSSTNFSYSTASSQPQLTPKQHRNNPLINMFKISSKSNQINSNPNQSLKNNQSIQSFITIEVQSKIRNQNKTFGTKNIQLCEKQLTVSNVQSKIDCQKQHLTLKDSINKNSVQIMKLLIQNIELQNNNKRLTLLNSKLSFQNKLLKRQIQKLLTSQGIKDKYEFNSKLYLYCINQKIFKHNNYQGKIDTQSTINYEPILNEEEIFVSGKKQNQFNEIEQFQQKYYIAEKHLFDARQQIKRLGKQIQFLKIKGLKDLEHERKIKNQECLFLQKKFKKLLDSHIEVLKTTKRLQLVERLKKIQQEKYNNIRQQINYDENSLFQLSPDNSFLP